MMPAEVARLIYTTVLLPCAACMEHSWRLGQARCSTRPVCTLLRALSSQVLEMIARAACMNKRSLLQGHTHQLHLVSKQQDLQDL
jgi:hypothetical protein